VDGPHPPVQLGTIAAPLQPVLSSPAVPSRARSTGIWRSLTVNSGRSHTHLTCAIGVGSRLSGLLGRAFQARATSMLGTSFSPNAGR
jgi:hypothetical protein